MALGLPSTSIGAAAVILVLVHILRSEEGTVRSQGAMAKASIKPVLGGLLSIMSGLLGGVIVNPIVLSFVFGIHWNLGTMVMFFLPSLACGIMAVAGGLSAMRRRRYWLALLGSALAIPSLVFMGVPAFVLVATSRDEFGGIRPAGPRADAAERP